MVSRCWLAQWRGFTPEEQAYMIQGSERGHPTFISLGHRQTYLWRIERFTSWSHYPLPGRPADDLISIKVDHWPEEFDLQKSYGS